MRAAYVSMAVLVALSLGLAACSDTDGERERPARSPSAATFPEDLTPTATGEPGRTTLTGTVSEGVEQGCLLLPAGGTGQPWLLVGTVAGIGAGDTVTVVGHAQPDLATSCQQGVPFVVEKVRAASPRATPSS